MLPRFSYEKKGPREGQVVQLVEVQWYVVMQ